MAEGAAGQVLGKTISIEIKKNSVEVILKKKDWCSII